jgi:nucleoside-diphosphate-sugar epimerase
MSGISVFGGTGFVGSEFCRVTKKNYQLISRELRSPVTSESVYFISTTDNYNVFDDLHVDIDTNLKVLMDVLKTLKPGESTFNFISSWFVYGDAELPATELSHCNPKGFYSITKRAAEQLLISYCETFGINYRILRLCNVYGAGDKSASKKKNALQYLIDRFKNGEEINLYHAGEFYRDYMHVTDVSRAIDLVIDKGELNQVYNIGSGEKVLFKDLITLITKETQSTSFITPIEPPKFHQTIQVKDFYFKTDKLKALGFERTISLQEGIKQLCQ